MKLLQDQVALITGSSRGIGRACALMFAQHGAKVVVNYRHRKNHADSLVEDIQSKGGEAIAIPADVSLEDDGKRLVDETLKHFDKLDILVNNAGIWIETPADTVERAKTDLTLDVNLKSVIFMSNLVVPVMRSQGQGKIINISSTAGQRGEAGHSVYAASKGGIIAFTRSLSTELAKHRILVNGVAPGWVDTDLNDSIFLDPDKKRKIEGTIPLGRIPMPEEIAYAVLFLSSNWSSAITGEVINVNGGSVLC